MRAEDKAVFIQWTGKYLREVLEFTGRDPRWYDWFKSWEEYEKYVHEHDDIFKLFCGDSHIEVHKGEWLIKRLGYIGVSKEKPRGI